MDNQSMTTTTTKSTFGVNRTHPASYPTEDMTVSIDQLRNNVASVIDRLQSFKAPTTLQDAGRGLGTVADEVNRRLDLAIQSLELASMRGTKALTHLPQRPQLQTTVPPKDLLNAPAPAQSPIQASELTSQFPDAQKLQAANQAVIKPQPEQPSQPAQHAYDPNAEYQKQLDAVRGVQTAPVVTDPYNL